MDPVEQLSGLKEKEKEKRRILWSPHKADQFVVAANDLRLYRVVPQAGADDATPEDAPAISHYELLEAQNFEASCVNWCPDSRDPNLLAFGLKGGKIRLNYLGERDVVGRFKPKVFVFAPLRRVISISWNKGDPTKIAAGYVRPLSKAPQLHGVLVWDINMQGSVGKEEKLTQPLSKSKKDHRTSFVALSSRKFAETRTETKEKRERHEASQPEEIVKPLAAMGLETIHAVEWVPKDKNVLCAASSTHIRLYDMRWAKPWSIGLQNWNLKVHAIQFDPHDSNRFATHGDGLISLWDMRKPSREKDHHAIFHFNPTIGQSTTHPYQQRHASTVSTAASSIPPTTAATLAAATSFPTAKLGGSMSEMGKSAPAITPRQINQMSWCPTRRNYLATLFEGDSSVRVWDLSGTRPEEEKLVEPESFRNQVPRTIQCDRPLLSFSWHPTHKPHFFTLSDRYEVEDKKVPHPIALTFSPFLSFGSETDLFFPKISETATASDPGDPEVMKRRAKSGYAIDPKENEKIAHALGQTDISRAWSYLISNGQDWTNLIEGGLLAVLTPSLQKSQPTLTKKVSEDMGKSSAPRAKTRLPMTAMGRSPQLSLAPPMRRPRRASLEEEDKSDDEESDEGDLGERTIVLKAGEAPLTSICVYYSPSRARALRMCGWSNVFLPLPAKDGKIESDQKLKMREAIESQREREEKNLEHELNQLENQGEYEKAAALSIFHLKLDRAVRALTEGATKQGSQALGYLALALSGYSTATSSRSGSSKGVTSMWKETCRSTFKLFLNNAYLKAAFSFLLNAIPDEAPKNETFKDIVDSPDIEVRQKIAFVCRFLPDSELLNFMNEAKKNATKQGLLEGLILTGLREEANDLLQAFVDRSGDIQTVACLAAYAMSYQRAGDKRLENWILTYRNLLNRWGLWTLRAKFDVARAMLMRREKAKGDSKSGTRIETTHTATTPPGKDDSAFPTSLAIRPQVYMRCQRCGKPLSLSRLSDPQKREFNPYARKVGTVRKYNIRTSNCTECKQGLPRCCVCLRSMEIIPPALGPKRRTAESSKESKTESADRSSPFSNWFSWCQLCRHGGHAEHISDWFKDHSVCPVTDCVCRCKSLDNYIDAL